jgi:hypothetical protein
MQQRRRRFIESLGSLSTVALAGCSFLSDEETVSDPTPEQSPSNTTTTDSDPASRPSTDPEIPATQSNKIVASDGQTADRFGASLAISSDVSTTIIGAPGVEDPNGDGTGSAYVFSSGGGSWTQRAKLASEDGDPSAAFGRSVAVSDDGATAIFGAPGDQPNDGRAGAAYVFSSGGDAWTQEAKLTGEDEYTFDAFGWSVAISGDGSTAIIGDRMDQGSNESSAVTNPVGEAYVFARRGGSWSREAKLSPNTVDPNEVGVMFGDAVDVSNDGSTAIVGARRGDDSNGTRTGAAYVYSNTGGSWTEVATLVSSDGETDDYFGESVVLSSDGSTAIIGARRDNTSNGQAAGSAYVFSARGSGWIQEAKLTASNGTRYERFGWSVAMSDGGSTATIGAPGRRVPSVSHAGSVYVFSSAGGSWTQEAKLTANDGDPDDYFGDSVALSSAGPTAIIGASGDEDPNGIRAGSAYVFE